MKNITTTTKTILFASLIAAMIIPLSNMQTADAATLCSDTGVDGSPRCYAIVDYSPHAFPNGIYFDGLYTSATFTDDVISDGFLQDSVWMRFVDGGVLEAGFQDQSTGNKYFVNAVDGVVQGTSGTPSHNTVYAVGVYDSNQDNTWTMKSHTQISTHYTTSNAWKGSVGTEAQFTNAPNNTTDFDNIYVYDNGWLLMSSAAPFYQGFPTPSSGWDTDTCGTSADEKERHVNTGKGTQSC